MEFSLQKLGFGAGEDFGVDLGGFWDNSGGIWGILGWSCPGFCRGVPGFFGNVPNSRFSPQIPLERILGWIWVGFGRILTKSRRISGGILGISGWSRPGFCRGVPGFFGNAPNSRFFAPIPVHGLHDQRQHGQGQLRLPDGGGHQQNLRIREEFWGIFPNFGGSWREFRGIWGILGGDSRILGGFGKGREQKRGFLGGGNFGIFPNFRGSWGGLRVIPEFFGGKRRNSRGKFGEF